MAPMPRNPHARIEIDAPLDRVWEVMLDTASYGEWNPFVQRADCAAPRVGEAITLHVRFANGSTATSPERITALDVPTTSEDGVRRALLAYRYEGLRRSCGWCRACATSGSPRPMAARRSTTRSSGSPDRWCASPARHASRTASGGTRRR